MTPRTQLEAQIIAALARLSPEDIQRVAEDYARIRHPARFPRFDYRALSPEGKSRPGWPDAWVCLDDRIDGVEATADKSKARVESHLRDDLKKAVTRSPPLSGLVIVSGCPTVNLSADEIVAWRQRFIDQAGIDSDRFDLIVGSGLVGELAHPEFTRTRIEVLGIPDAPNHFKLVRARRGPDESRLNSDFIPSEEDYEKNRVHRPAAAQDVLAHLRHAGRALVRGVGASGKTVLAWLLALESAEKRQPSYYLDLAGYAEAGPDLSNALIEDLQRFAHGDSLFVLDNCHLDEPLAKEVALAWEDLSGHQQPRLLLVGRELRTARGSVIEGLSLPTIALRAREPELLGVYRRLAVRTCGTGEPPEPPPPVLEDWVRTFGGDPSDPETTTDLIAFSAAVTRRLPDLLACRWTLSARDAIDEVREAYLNKLSEGETQNLIRLAACQGIEFALAHEALADRPTGLRLATRQLGLVFRYSVGGAGQYVRYRLAHAALGDLILAAAERAVDTELERRRAALQYPHSVGAMLGRLMALGMRDEASRLASALLARPRSLSEMGSLNYLHLFLLRVRSLDVAIPATVEEELAEATNRSRLTKAALKTPLHFLANFLSFASKIEGMEPVFDALAQDLSAPENRQKLTEQALLTPLELLAHFLAYASKAMRPVFEALAKDLSASENRQELTERALLTPLENLAHFLDYGSRTEEVRPVFESLAEDLAASENREKLTERALLTPLENLAHFLRCAANTSRLTVVFDGLAENLSAPENVRDLATRMASERLDAVVGTMRADGAQDLWHTVFAEMDEELWDEARRVEPKPNLEAFVAFQRVAAEEGRWELARTPAFRLVNESTSQEWHRPGIGLHHLSHVIRLATETSEAEIDAFLARVATPGWIDGFMTSVSSGGLAGNLLGFASALGAQRSAWLRRASLERRVKRELSSIGKADAETAAQSLALLGSAAAIGMRVQGVSPEWPEDPRLAELLALRLPDHDRATIGPLQVQFWLGLREMARLRQDSPQVPAELADPILDLWIATDQTDMGQACPFHVRSRNADMIAWLEQCKLAGWRLVPPNIAPSTDSERGQGLRTSG